MKIFHEHIRDSFSRRFILFYVIFSFTLIFYSCSEDWSCSFSSDTQVLVPDLKTQNIVIVVVDGLRYSEGWGEANHKYIPFMADSMAKYGVVNSAFYNLGNTYTTAGHTSILTGIYQPIDNEGNELPQYPSVFQYWNKYSLSDSQKSWVIASKGKLKILSDCNYRSFKGKYRPSFNCGTDGLGNGYREDSLTLNAVMSVFSDSKPKLMLINFRDPDYSAHSGDWKSYVKAIRATDRCVFRL